MGQGSFAAAASPRRGPTTVVARAAVGQLADLIGRDRRAGGTGARGPALELDAGTGVLSGQLHRAGVRIVTVEPDAARRAQLRRAVPDVPVLAAAAGALPLRTGAASTVVVTRAELLSGEPMTEIRRVLGEGGRLLAVLDADEGEAEPPSVAELATKGFEVSAQVHPHLAADGTPRATTVVVAHATW